MRRRYNPLRPLTPQQQMALANRYVRSQYAPLIRNINRDFGARARAGEQSIAGYTNQLARELGGMRGETHNIYAGAQESQRAVDTALANRLTAAGQSLGSEAAQKIAAAGLNPAVNNLAATGAGAAAASS